MASKWNRAMRSTKLELAIEHAERIREIRDQLESLADELEMIVSEDESDYEGMVRNYILPQLRGVLGEPYANPYDATLDKWVNEIEESYEVEV